MRSTAYAGTWHIPLTACLSYFENHEKQEKCQNSQSKTAVEHLTWPLETSKQTLRVGFIIHRVIPRADFLLTRKGKTIQILKSTEIIFLCHGCTTDEPRDENALLAVRSAY